MTILVEFVINLNPSYNQAIRFADKDTGRAIDPMLVIANIERGNAKFARLDRKSNSGYVVEINEGREFESWDVINEEVRLGVLKQLREVGE